MSAAACDTLPLETPLCPGCGSDHEVPVATRAAWAPCRVVRCLACGLAYLSPRLTQEAIGALYAHDAYFAAEPGAAPEIAGGYGDYAAQEQALRLTFRRWLRVLDRHGVRGRALLEIGCGRGYLLDEARRGFARRDGTELSPRAAAAARAHADRVHVGGIEDLPGDERYDVVLSNHVIEHVYAPLAFLEAQVARLRPGGALVVATPYMGSFWQRLLGARWPSYKVPEHVLYLERRTLGGLLERAGLHDVVALPYLHAFPLSLVGEKLGLRVPEPLGRASLWIPRTTLGMVGFRS